MNTKYLLLLFITTICSLTDNANSQVPRVLQKIHQTPFFIENKGQWSEQVLFLTRINDMDAWITKDGIVYDFYKIEKEQTSDHRQLVMPDRNDTKTIIRYGHVVAMQLQGATNSVSCTKEDRQSGYYNYFIGNDSSKWTNHVGLFGSVTLKDVYKKIDMRMYYTVAGLRYDFIVHAGANPSQIAFRLNGAEDVHTDLTGNLVFTTRFGEHTQADLVAYQGDKSHRVACRFQQRADGTISFSVKDYDPTQPLIIDPLIYSTYLGGGNSDIAYGVSVDDSDHVYVAGYTYSTDFPITTGTYQTTFDGSADAFVTKLSEDGSSLIYSSYLGGGSEDYCYSIAIDGSGCAFISGNTYSNNFPITSGAYQSSFGGNNSVFITKFSGDGSALVYSTYLGGSSNDKGKDIVIDSMGYAYITGYTGSTDFPITPGAYQTIHGTGYWDAFVTKLDINGDSLLYSTYFGAGDDDFGYGITIDGNGCIYITGKTESIDLPVTSGSYQTSNLGYTDAFVMKLNADGSALVYSTYLGGSDTDVGYGIAIDDIGCVYVTGLTNSTDFPISSGSFQTSNAGGNDIFITKLNAGGDSILCSTYIGGSGNDDGFGITLNDSGKVYVMGQTNSTDFPVTIGAIQPTYGGGDWDTFVIQLSANGLFLTYSTFLGGDNRDYDYGIVSGSGNNIYMVGQTYSTNFPVTQGVYQNVFGGGSFDAFVTKIEMQENITINTVLCDGQSYTSPSGQYIWDTTGTYHDTIYSQLGLDTIYTINLTILTSQDTTIDTTICAGEDYVSPSGFYSWSTTGTYYDTLHYATGCDSIRYTVYLTVNEIDISVSEHGDTLIANASNAAYQWLVDCNTLATPIAGATSQSFTPLVSGYYSVIVTQNGCTDTSDCYHVIIAGIPDVFESYLHIYPNPVSHIMMISGTVRGKVLLMDLTGKLLKEVEKQSGTMKINLQNLPSGFYMLKVVGTKQTVIRKIEKQ